MTAIHIGICGWRYKPWRGDFYPEGLTQRHELQFASGAVNSIEINGSFYALQTPQRYAQWYADTHQAALLAQHMPRERKNREVFCYFDNEIKVRAPFDARQRLQRFGLDKGLATQPGILPGPGVLP